MAERGKPWHVCDDCLEPLAGELFALARRFRIPFDVAKRDRLEAEYEGIVKAGGYSTNGLPDAQQKRLDELSQQLKAQQEPPRWLDVDRLYREYKIDLATDWLKFNVSVDYAADFHRTLTAAQKRFSALDFKACQIINGDVGKETTVQIRYAIQRLIDRHYELVRALRPDMDSAGDWPERDQLPDDLRAFEVEILDEYDGVVQQFEKTAEYLRRVSALVRSKLAKAQAPSNLGLIDRLLTGPDHAELTPSELALLEAYLKQPSNRPTLGELANAANGRAPSERAVGLQKLKLIRDYNRNLQSVIAKATTEPKPDTTSAHAPTRRGRPKAGYETVQREAQIAADWKQAKEAGTYKGDFARDRGTTVAELDALLDRVAKRNRPSE